MCACVEKESHATLHTTPTSTHRCSMRRTIHNTHTLCALEGRGVSGKGRGEGHEGSWKREGHEGSGKRGGA